MQSFEAEITKHDGSKEAAALALLNETLGEPSKPRRVRRRRRSVRRRLVDGLMPFAVLVGLTFFAAGVVSVVEIGAAGSSKVKSQYTGEATTYEPVSGIDFENSQVAYRNMMRQHAELKSKKKNRRAQVSYQLGVQNQAARELSGLDDVIPPPAETGADDIIDWSLFEEGSPDPRSTLQRTGGRTQPASD